MTRRETSQGFTLVEMLVALTVLAIVSVSLLSLHRSAVSTWQRNEVVMTRTQELEALQAIIRGRLSEADPEIAAEEPGKGLVAFGGTSHSLTFLAPLLQSTGTTTIAWYRVSGAEDGMVQIAWALKPDEVPATKTLLHDPVALIFSFYGSDQPGTAPTWRSTWLGMKALPLLVRMSVRFRDGKLGDWPDLVVAPRVTAGANCVFDQADGRCRGS